jgi:hypothetical protein
VNGDGRLDVVSADSGSAQITVYPALDDGFAPPKQFFLGPQPLGVAARERDCGGRTDLIGAGFGDTNQAVVMTGARARAA